MPFYNQAEIEKAREVDLFTYLQTCEPQELVHVSGNIYCTREHDSLRSRKKLLYRLFWRIFWINSI